jgi:hypothetical protein
MRKIVMRNLIAGTVVTASVLALTQSAHAQYYGRSMYGGPGAYRPDGSVAYPRPIPGGPGAWGPGGPVGYPRPMYGGRGGPVGYGGPMPPPVLPYPSPRPTGSNSYAQMAPQQPQNQGARWNTTSNGWPEFPTLSQDVQGAQQFWNNVVVPACTLFC